MDDLPATDAGPLAIELVEVTKRFPRADAPAVDHLNLEIRRGELAVLVGPSGCGKTTTLRMINRLEEPTSGSILVEGVDTSTLAPHELRRRIGYVIQQVGLFPHRTVGDNISTVPRLLGWPAKRTAARVRELAELVDLEPGLLERYPAALSGGQQQRVGVARALAADPPILLMDEPYSAVDPVVRTRLQDQLLELHQRLGTTIVLVTHDIDEAVKVGDRVAVLGRGGTLAQYDRPTDLLARPIDEFVTEFLGGDRFLRRLALVPAAQLPMRAGVEAPAVSIDHRANGRAAVDAMVAAGSDRIAVTDGGTVVGVVVMTDLGDA